MRLASVQTLWLLHVHYNCHGCTHGRRRDGQRVKFWLPRAVRTMGAPPTAVALIAYRGWDRIAYMAMGAHKGQD